VTDFMEQLFHSYGSTAARKQLLFVPVLSASQKTTPKRNDQKIDAQYCCRYAEFSRVIKGMAKKDAIYQKIRSHRKKC
jgi:hypothetical protein